VYYHDMATGGSGLHGTVATAMIVAEAVMVVMMAACT
jgi:hypothetical protein